MKKETKKENLLRRLEENREFYYACGRMSMVSLLEELTEYITNSEEGANCYFDEDTLKFEIKK